MRLFKYTLSQPTSHDVVAPVLRLIKGTRLKKAKPTKKPKKKKRKPRVHLFHAFEDAILQVLYDSRAAELQCEVIC